MVKLLSFTIKYFILASEAHIRVTICHVTLHSSVLSLIISEYTQRYLAHDSKAKYKGEKPQHRNCQKIDELSDEVLHRRLADKTFIIRMRKVFFLIFLYRQLEMRELRYEVSV